jgi:hypothetical protein
VNVIRNVAHKAVSALDLLKKHPGQFIFALTGRIETYIVYSARSDEISRAEGRPGAVFRSLDGPEIIELARQNEELRNQAEGLREIGISRAFGVVHDGTVASFCWLLTAADESQRWIQRLKLRPGEAEVAFCYTLRAFRGLGLYPLAIRSACAAARELGVVRLFMVTTKSNIASQRGIEKAGLSRCGSTFRIVLPFFPSARGLFWRPFRRAVGGSDFG